MPGASPLFVFGLQSGMPTFNILHPVWVMLDENRDAKHVARHDKQVMRLQEWLAFKVLLAIGTYGPEELLARLNEIHREVMFYAPLFCEV